MKELVEPEASGQPIDRSIPAKPGRDQSYPPIDRGIPSFRPSQMQAFLDGADADIRSRVKELLSEPEFSYGDSLGQAEYRKQVLAWTQRVAAAGVGQIFLPRYLGGEDNLQKFLAASETLAFHDLSLLIKIGVQFGLFAGSIQRLGTEYHHRKYLIDAASAKLLGCFAMTEIGHGSNVQGIETTARYEPATEEFVINSPTFSAGKTYIGNAACDARLATVFAQLEIGGKSYGVHAFLVPLRDAADEILPGIEIEDNGPKIGLNGVDNGRIWFNRVRIPRSEMLDRFAQVEPDGKYQSSIASTGARFFTMIGTLVSGRIMIGATSNSVAKSALTIAVRYAARRRQFGPEQGQAETLVLDYPATQRRLFPLLANVYALDFAFRRLVRKQAQNETGKQTRQIETSAAALKAFATWNSFQTAQTCREVCGGEGYMTPNRFAALKADVDIFTTFEGDNTVLLQLVAKNLLATFKEEFGRLKPGQQWSFLANQIWNRTRSIGLSRFRLTPPRFLDPETQLTFLRLREKTLLWECAQAFRVLVKRSDSYAAFLRLQPRLLDLARAHTDRAILEAFVSGISSVTEPSLQRPLKLLRDLFAVTHLDAQRGWYLENRYLNPRDSQQFSWFIDKLCHELRPEAVALVDSFGIPDKCLAAPIAL
jgi:acyl-CoA oxidase